MTRTYTYNRIRCYYYGGMYNAEYIDKDGKIFGLHGGYCRTKKDAFDEAKKQIDFLNNYERR